MEQKEIKETKKKINTKKFYSGTGRRKSSVARVWLFDEKGEFVVNGKEIKEFLVNPEALLEWVKPFHAVGVSHPQSKFSGTLKVHGGGKQSQVTAIKLGIARALVSFNEEFKPVLRSSDLLTRDPRKVERKKPFLRKARKSPQYSKR
jgi:small subunit ribosomal protein S9